MTTRKRTIVASVIAATSLVSLSPVRQGAVLMAAGAAALWSAPVLAANTIPGVGTVIKKKPGDSPIIVPSDGKGEVRLSALEPGEYSVQVFGSTEETALRAGPDGRLAFVVLEAVERVKQTAEDAKARVSRTPPVKRRWVEPIQELKGGSVIVGLLAGAQVDINSADVEQIARATGTSMQSAVHIMAQREKGGPYTSIEDFARRNCPTMAIEMDRGAVKLGEATFMFAASTNKQVVPGFRCGPRGGEQFSLYGKKHNYVGHVTLLR